MRDKTGKGDEGLCEIGNIWRELCARAVGARMGGGSWLREIPDKKGAGNTKEKTREVAAYRRR